MLIICIVVVAVIVTVVVVYLFVDYMGPATISLKPDKGGGHHKKKAKELIVQEYDREGNLWASRGMLLYRQKKGADSFKRMAHVPSGFSFYMLYNFSLFRWFVNKPECIVFSITGENHICTMSAGYIWHSPVSKIKFKKTLKMRHFGMGVGRGIFSNGIASVGKDHVYFGEYFRNSNRTNVRIYESTDNGCNWHVAHEFAAGKIRHIHTIQEDPYDGKLWVCCGDLDGESRIGYSMDKFRTIIEIGSGSQMWRTCQLVFTENKIYWGADTGEIDYSGIYCWDKRAHEVTKICQVKGAILYGNALPNGNKVFTTDREGFDNENDAYTRLIFINSNEDVFFKKIGTWKHSKRDYRYSFAMLRIPRNQKNDTLYVSVINQNEYLMGELLVYDQEIWKQFKEQLI